MLLSPGPAASLLIFDCDGVLVDSEIISVQVLAEVLADERLAVDEDYIYRRFLGRSMDTMREGLADDFGYRMSDALFATIRQRMESRLSRELEPIPGITDVLPRLPGARCVASSSRPERIRLSLKVTNLIGYFDPNIFSATMVQAGKPAPDLFLHAARAMGFAPESCIVIEDSPAGVQAAQRAGMRVYGFTGGAHAVPSRLHSALAALNPDAIFDTMLRLPELLSEEPGRQ